MRALITWEQFLYYLTFIVGVYYVVVVVLNYRKDVQRFSKTKNKMRQSVATLPSEKPGAKQPMQDAAVHNMVLDLIEDFKSVFHAAAQQSLNKEQVVAALQVRMAQYPMIKDTMYRGVLNEHIAQELDLRLGMELTVEDMTVLWFQSSK